MQLAQDQTEKQCKRCEKIKPISEYSKDKNRSDGLNPCCKTCIKEYQQNLKEKRMVEDPALYCLRQSVNSAFRRGSKSYNRGQYKNIRVNWTYPKNMLHDLSKNEQFMKNWRKQYAIFEKLGFRKNERPTIDRIDPNGNYEMGNIQVESFGYNASKARKSISNN